MAAALALAASATAQDWPAYGGASGGGQYSPATLIDRANVHLLRPAWVAHTGELGQDLARAEKLTFEANPLYAEGRLYLSTATGIVVALDAASGHELWRADARIDRQAHYGELASRGVASWVDPGAAADALCRHAVFLGTTDARLLALDGRSGRPCTGFGQAGTVNLKRGVRRSGPDYVLTSPPVVVGDVLVVGSAIGDNRAVEVEEGVVRAFDARSGRPLWSWDPIPRRPQAPTASGNWSPAQAERTGAANTWAPMSVDIRRGWVFLPTSSPSPDFYGGERLGANRDANSVVVLRAATGEVVWRQQLVHHDLWDYDLAAQPVLATLSIGGRPREVVIQATKMGFIFVMDRETGEFVFPVAERPVPASDVPGEQAWPTQPFPEPWLRLVDTEPVGPDTVWGFTPLDRMACRRKVQGLRSGGIFTPPSLQGSIESPGYAGGINWGGVSLDPVRQVLVVPVLQVAMTVTLLPRQAGVDAPSPEQRRDHPDSDFSRMAGTPYAMRREALLSPLGAPCSAPPWGKMVALDLRAQRHLWERPIGTTAKLAPVAMDLGVPFMGGAITTASGLVFMGGTTDNQFRAYDIDTGRELWKAELPAGGQATPMTYVHQGRQYVVIAAGGHGGLGTSRGDSVVAFALP